MAIYIYNHLWLVVYDSASSIPSPPQAPPARRQVTLTVELPVAADVASSAAANSCEHSNPFMVNMGMVYYWA